jgi:polyferredoxin
MAVVISYSLKWTVEHRRRPGSLMMPFVVFVLVMMLSMVASAVVYFTSPGLTILIELVVVNMSVMGVGALPFVFVIFRAMMAEGEQAEPSRGPPRAVELERTTWGGWVPAATVVALVLANEFFMGWGFQLASGGFPAPLAPGFVPLFASVVSSYWFLFTMAFEMALTAFFIRKEISAPLLVVIACQSAIMFLSPTAISTTGWVTASVFGGSAVMVLLFVYAFEHLAKNPMVDLRLSRYLLALMAAYGIMMAGLYLWELNTSEIVFAASIILEMAIYLGAVVTVGKGTSIKSWKSDPWWAMGVLTALFVAEFFMGALLDAQVNGAQSLITSANLVPVMGNPLAALAAGGYDFIAFFSVVTLSPWFLIMMGAEMGSLVVFRMKEVRELETRVRLGLVILAYGVYSVYLPSYLIPNAALPKIPFVGWSMGVGTTGAVAPAILLALIGTYLISGMLSLLFGSRQVCSMFCTAALMYQGTFYDSMKTFNRTSTIGKKLLTSRLSNLYRLIFSVVWVSLIAAVVVSYLDSIGVLNLAVFGGDPTVFLYTFYFGFLWYLIFVTIPFVGVYGCVTMGWCSWGTFNQLVGRLGFFKLKVRDPKVCVTCETKDCAKACPVGLTDLPGSFIAKGEFKSSKCIGVGDCVGACPYSNEYFYDIRGWLKRGRSAGTSGAMIDLKIAQSRPD